MNQRLGDQQSLLTQQQIRERSDAILGQNLEQNGELAQPDYVPHHIISPFDEQIKAARDVKALFDHFFPPQSYQHLPLDQWPINQAFNGVWLRHDRLHFLKPKEMPSFFMHDADYYQTLYERLKNRSNQADFLAELQHIKEDLSEHRFWDQNPSKLAEIEAYRQIKIAEEQMLATSDAEMETYLSEELKAELDKWPSLEAAAIKEAADEFSDILQRYEEAQENQNPAQFDAFLFQGLSHADNMISSPSFDLSELRKVLDQKGFLGYQQPFYSADLQQLEQQNQTQQSRQRQRLFRTLQQESQRSLQTKLFQIKPFQKKHEFGRSK